jgi:hypothetical protein
MKIRSRHVAEIIAKKFAATESTESWDTHRENGLVIWASKVKSMRWLHQMSAVRYDKRYSWIAYPSIIANTALAIMGSDSHGSEGMRYFLVFLNVIAALLASYSKFLNFAKRAEAHRNACTQYTVLYRKIVFECSKPRHERVRADEFISQVRAGMDDLLKTSPSVPFAVIQKYNRTFGRGAIKPDIAHIDVNNVREIEFLLLSEKEKETKRPGDESWSSLDGQTKSQRTTKWVQTMSRAFEKARKLTEITLDPSARESPLERPASKRQDKGASDTEIKPSPVSKNM